MTKTKAPTKTPSPASGTKPDKAADIKSDHTRVFITMALDMSWRLAFVVLVPILGGFALDQRLKMTPILTIVGFLLAMLGMGLVMWDTMQRANNLTSKVGKK